MDEQEFCYIYPRFMLHEERGILPDAKLPRDYRERVSRFYSDGGRERIEDYTRRLKPILEGQFFHGFPWEINLQWDDAEGLTNISFGPAGFDIERGHFVEHNLGGIKSLAAMAVSAEYVYELMNA